jgi:NAD+ synthase (glutamine-hydrolysing)
MVGGFAVLKDVYKTIVFELAKYRNSLSDTPVIPERVITRPPSAELRPDQKIRTHYLLMIFWMRSCMPILKKIKVRLILLPKVLTRLVVEKVIRLVDRMNINVVRVRLDRVSAHVLLVANAATLS